MNKKGQSEEIAEQIGYLILTLVVMGGVLFLLGYYTGTTIDVAPIQANVFLYRTIYAPNTISLTDPMTGRVYPGIIVDSNFTTSHLEAAINYSYEKQIAAKLEILDYVSKEVMATAYYNQEWYGRLEPLARAGLTGFGAAKYYLKEIPVIYRKGDVDFSAILRIQVIVPN
jgi:hypothetical protein